MCLICRPGAHENFQFLCKSGQAASRADSVDQVRPWSVVQADRVSSVQRPTYSQLWVQEFCKWRLVQPALSRLPWMGSQRIPCCRPRSSYVSVLIGYHAYVSQLRSCRSSVLHGYVRNPWNTSDGPPALTARPSGGSPQIQISRRQVIVPEPNVRL